MQSHLHVRSAAVWTLTLWVCACGTPIDSDDGDIDSVIDSDSDSDSDTDKDIGPPFEPQTGGVPWNGISWVGMPWQLVPTAALGKSGYPSSGRVELDKGAVNGLLATDDGRSILEYLSQCALPAGAALVTEINGETFEFRGVLNLAPDWVERPINDEEKAWVSACVLMLVNPTGVHVPVSPRGNHPALEARIGADELEAYPYEEAAFYGDIFANPPKTYVCVGADLLEHIADDVAGVAHGLSSDEYFSFRVCARQDCGFVNVGTCFDPFAVHACTEETDPVSAYEGCYDQLGELPWPAEAVAYNAVMTSNLTEEDGAIYRGLALDAMLPN